MGNIDTSQPHWCSCPPLPPDRWWCEGGQCVLEWRMSQSQRTTPLPTPSPHHHTDTWGWCCQFYTHKGQLGGSEWGPLNLHKQLHESIRMGRKYHLHSQHIQQVEKPSLLPLNNKWRRTVTCLFVHFRPPHNQHGPPNWKAELCKLQTCTKLQLSTCSGSRYIGRLPKSGSVCILASFRENRAVVQPKLKWPDHIPGTKLAMPLMVLYTITDEYQ